MYKDIDKDMSKQGVHELLRETLSSITAGLGTNRQLTCQLPISNLSDAIDRDDVPFQVNLTTAIFKAGEWRRRGR